MLKKVFILVVMGRNAGWIAAASGLAHIKESDGPHIILFPEIPFIAEKFLLRVKKCVKKFGYAIVVASEGIGDENARHDDEQGDGDYNLFARSYNTPVIQKMERFLLRFCHR